MQSTAETPKQYVDALPADRKMVISELRKVIKKNLPAGFSEVMSYGSIGYVVPHSIYPDGYYVDPARPLPFLNIASQKNFVAIYHMGVYADRKLLDWFTKAFPKHSRQKLDMGKSCIRFKKMDQIPYALIGELVAKVSPVEWIETYERNIRQ